MIKKISLFSLAAASLAAFNASADVLTPEQAYQAATRQGNASKVISRQASAKAIVPMLTVKDFKGDAAVYLFSDEAGSIVASAESGTPALLGYSDKKIASPGEIPDGLQYWMDYYTNEIQQYREGKYIERPMRASYENYAPVAPMLETLWDQESPYYNMCPRIGMYRCPSGCVATAMAQAMKYYNWPEQGKGSMSYYWESGNQTLSADFSASVYDWDNMLNTYTTSSSTTSKNAVALLMRDTGYSVMMDYYPSGSGARDQYIPSALYDYFSYDKSIRFESRDYYYNDEWIALVYSDVAAGHPVVYSGAGEAGGHCFVCDGYSSDGFFHFNWGWSGVSDGYYRLSALAPDVQGVGGNDGNFNCLQSIVYGMKKPEADSQLSIVIGTDSNVVAGATSYSSGNATIKASIINYSVESISGTFGVKLIPAEGEPIYVQGTDAVTMTSLRGNASSVNTVKVPVANFPTEGTYTVQPAFYTNDGKWVDVAVSHSYPKVLQVVANNGTLRFSNVNAPAYIEVSNFQLTSSLYVGKTFSVTFNVTCAGTEDFLGNMRLGLYSGNSLVSYSDVFDLNLEPGQSETIDMYANFLIPVSAGTYTMRLMDNMQYNYASKLVKMSNAPSGATKVTLTDLEVANAASTSTSGGRLIYKVNPEDIQIAATVTCTQGYLADAIEAYVYPISGGSPLASLGSCMNLLESGASAPLNIKGKFTDGVDGSNYMIGFYMGYTQLNNVLYITPDSTLGVVAATAEELQYAIEGDTLRIFGNEDGTSVARIYGADGNLVKESASNAIDISDVKAGVYFLILTDGTTAKTAKILR